MDMNEVLYQTMLERMEQMETSIKSLNEKSQKLEPSVIVDPNYFSDCLKNIEKRIVDLKTLYEGLKNKNPQVEYNSIAKQFERTIIETFNKIVHNTQLFDKVIFNYKVINIGLAISFFISIIWIILLQYYLADVKENAIKYEYLKANNNPQIKKIIERSDSIYEVYGYDFFNQKLKEHKVKLDNKLYFK